MAISQRPKNQKAKNNNASYLPLQRFSLFFFRRPRTTALLALTVVLFGALSYTTLMSREGFPSVNTPFAVAQGTYFVNNPGAIDKTIASPISKYLLKQAGVKSVDTQSYGNFYNIIVSYDDNVNAVTRSADLQKKIRAQGLLPDSASLTLEAFKFGFTARGDDAVISFIDKTGHSTTEQLVSEARQAANYFTSQKLSLVKDVSVIDPFEAAQAGALDGKTQITQKSFDRYGEQKNGSSTFYPAVIIGFTSVKGADNVKLDDQISKAVSDYNQKIKDSGSAAVVSASYAPNIKQQISELQKTLLEGLVAVLIVGSVVIALRASVITVLSMVTVLATTIGILYLIGYTLNTITLFALILGLSLIVDDTIIMVEALDAERRRNRDRSEIVGTAVRKVGRAMVAATSTAVLSFAPLIFVGGILGSFIRAIPITIILALTTSLVVALIFIPLYARYILLGDKQLGKQSEKEPAAGVEAKIAKFISGPMLWAQHSKLKLAGVGIVAVLISFGFIGAGGYLFSKVTFNIFPSSKDSNQIRTTLSFPSGTDITKAEMVTDSANKLIAHTVGPNFVRADSLGFADAQSTQLMIDLTDYNSRSESAPQIITDLKQAFKDFDGATFSASSVDAGPPPANFVVRVSSASNRESAIQLAESVASYLKTVELKRVDGSTARIESVTTNTDVYTRNNDKAYIAVTTVFADTDTTTLVTLAKDAVQKHFDPQNIASFGLPKNAITFDAGQEDQNQDSFKTMALAFPILLVVIYVLLSFQFRSLLQPLLIFLAIPFSLFGVTLGLFVTDNPFSFFALLGFFALIGLSLKNTILLVDYANQARRQGMNPVDAAHEALAERFRPLIATSFTAVFSLIPLAISSPFWQGLTVVLIFGLLSSTFLVVTVFPYFYLAGEFARGLFRRNVSRRIKHFVRRSRVAN